MDLKEAFQTEIEFWEDMLLGQAGELEPEVLQRIKMAKCLAEQKLSLYSTDCDHKLN